MPLIALLLLQLPWLFTIVTLLALLRLAERIHTVRSISACLDDQTLHLAESESLHLRILSMRL